MFRSSVHLEPNDIRNKKAKCFAKKEMCTNMYFQELSSLICFFLSPIILSFIYFIIGWTSERKHTEDVIKPDSGLLFKILIHVIGISALNVYNYIWPHIWMTRTDLVEDLDEWNIFINLSWLKWFWPLSLVEQLNDIFFCTVGFLYRV